MGRRGEVGSLATQGKYAFRPLGRLTGVGSALPLKKRGQLRKEVGHAKRRQSDPRATGEARQRFLDLINGREQGWPAREEFFRWMRQEMNAHGRLEPYWASLRAGHPVPWRLIEWLAVYAASNWQWEESATAMGIEVQPDAAQARELDADNVWKKSAGWRAALRRPHQNIPGLRRDVLSEPGGHPLRGRDRHPLGGEKNGRPNAK